MSADFHTHDLTAEGRALVSAEHPVPGKLVSLELHPWSVGADFPGLPEDLSVRLEKCAALGEVGFDPLRGDATRQLELLPELLTLAAELNKPVVLHLVRPTEAVFGMLERYPLRYLVHGFRGKAEMILYFVGNGVLLAAYWLVYARYMQERTRRRALTLAVVPACIFFLSGLLLRHWLLAGFAILFAAGHIYVTEQNQR